MINPPTLTVDIHPSGRGYVVRMEAHGQSFTYDKEQLSLADAMSGANMIREELNLPLEAIKLTSEALEANKKNDFYSAMMYKDINGAQQYIRPESPQVKDFSPNPNDSESELISMRGLVKLSYIMMIDEKNRKAELFMNEYYKLLAMRRYGKTAAAIKQEVKKMSKDQGIRWVEETFAKYVFDHEIMEIFQRLGGEIK